MKKSFLALLMVIALASFTNAGTFFNPVNITLVESKSNGTVVFQTDGGFPTSRWWLITVVGSVNQEAKQNLITTLLTAKAANLRIRFEEYGLASGDTWYVSRIQIQ